MVTAYDAKRRKDDASYSVFQTTTRIDGDDARFQDREEGGEGDQRREK
jgi:hypothetical protein